MPAVVEVDHLCHAYGDRAALVDVSFTVNRGELFGFLGPNGGGKTTLFRILTTLFAAGSGTARILGLDVRADRAALRRKVGVVFQAPALDVRLTIAENLKHQGHLYGLSGRALSTRIDSLLERFSLADRRKDLVIRLSGGLRRRVELVRALLARPEVLLLDEPSTGLDPGVRREFWNYLTELRRTEGITALLTTHLMDEADDCDRIAILDQGRVVALDTPEVLKAGVGGDVITLSSRDAEQLCNDIRQRYGDGVSLVGTTIRIERPKAHEFVAGLVEAFPGRINTVTVSRPTLEDVFIRLTGHSFT